MHADQQLSKSLKPRHLSMIAIAGVIGAGLFVGMLVLDSTRESLLLSLALAVVVVGIGILRYRRHGEKIPGSSRGDTPVPAVAEGATRGA